MKKMLILLCAGALVALDVSAETRKWIAGSGDWSVAANWENGTKPGQWDIAQFPSTTCITVNVDVVGGVTLGRLETSSGTEKVTFTGEKITLNGWIPVNFASLVDFYTPIDILKNNSSPQYIESSSRVNFYAPMTIASTIAELQFTGASAGSNGGPYAFYSTVTGGQKVYSCSSFYIEDGAVFDAQWLQLTAGYCDGSSTIRSSGMGVKRISTGWSYTRIFSADAMPNAVVTPITPIGNYATSGSFYLRESQTFDRFDGTCSFVFGASSNPFRLHGEKDGLILTLNGTADGTSPIKLDNYMNLVWNPTNDYTQTFSNRTHTLSGSIQVNRGTVRLVGTTSFANVPTITLADRAAFSNESTVASSLAGLKTLTLGDNAIFSLAASAATTPITGLTRVTLGTGAKLAIPADCALTASVLLADGVYPVAGTYTGADDVAGATKVDWIEGAGTITVANANVTSWKTAASGNWDDAANWSGGVPTADMVTYVGAHGSDYVITLSSSSVWPKDLTAKTPNATFRVPTGAEVIYNGSGKTSALKLQNGARLLVDGGLCSFTNYTGTFTVEGTAAATSRVEVAGGTFLYRRAGSTNGANLMTVNPYGEVRLTGGAFYDVKNDSSYAGVKYAGGRLVATGGTYHPPIAPDSSQRIALFDEGDVDFSGTAVMSGGDGSTITLNPAAGKTARLVFRDAAQKGVTGSLRMGDGGGGKSIVTFASSATHEAFIYSTYVGRGFGEAELNVSAGVLPIRARGIMVGGDENRQASTGVKGVLNLSGGVMTYLNQDISGWTGNWPLGLGIGYGGVTTVASGRPYVGEMNLTGGAFTNAFGHTLVGVGYGKGTWTQTDGTYVNLYRSAGTWGCGMIGALGGEGALTMSGGTFDFASRMYVGGGRTNDLVKGQLYAAAGLPADSHSAEGSLTFSGGDMIFRENLVIGSNGTGTLARVGSVGTFDVKGVLDLATQDLGGGATSQAKLVCTLDAEGLGAIKATSAMLRDGTEVTVDFTAYQGGRRRFKLIDTAALTADLSQLKVTYKDDSGRHLEKNARLILSEKGLYATFAPLGTAVIVR